MTKYLRLTLTFALAALSAAALATTASAAPTTLDPTFGTNGYSWVTADPSVGAPGLQAGRSVQTANGDYVSVDQRCDGPDCTAIASRIDSEGQFVAGFGSGGIVEVEHDVDRFQVSDVAEMSDGNLLLVGAMIDSDTGDDQYSAAMIDGETGELLTDYGTDGFEVFGTPAADKSLFRVRSFGVGLAAVGVSLTGMSTEVIPFMPNGAPMTAVPVEPAGTPTFFGADIAIDADGVFVVGAVINDLFAIPAMAKVDEAGVVDTWAEGGFAPVGATGLGFASHVEHALDGDLLVVGSTTQGFISKIDAAGELDETFGEDGTTWCAAPVDGSCTYFSIDASGPGIVLGGSRDQNTAPTSASLVTRLTDSGQPDLSFAPDGEHAFEAGIGSRTVTFVDAGADGRIVFRAQATFDDGVGDLDGAVFGRLGYEAPPAPPTETEPPAETPPAAIPLFTQFALKSKLKAVKFKSLSGTAAGTGLKRVEIAIQRVDSKLLKKKKRCLYLKNARGGFTKTKPVKNKCAPAKGLAATGTTNWSFRLRKKLPPGKYVISVRPVGEAPGTFINKKLTLTK